MFFSSTLHVKSEDFNNERFTIYLYKLFTMEFTSARVRNILQMFYKVISPATFLNVVFLGLQTFYYVFYVMNKLYPVSLFTQFVSTNDLQCNLLPQTFYIVVSSTNIVIYFLNKLQLTARSKTSNFSRNILRYS